MNRARGSRCKSLMEARSKKSPPRTRQSRAGAGRRRSPANGGNWPLCKSFHNGHDQSVSKVGFATSIPSSGSGAMRRKQREPLMIAA